MDVTTETFEAEVIERSRERPVAVDVWDGWPVPFGLESRGLGADRQP
jgi:thioredoxin-like negative regulator of GroEL